MTEQEHAVPRSNPRPIAQNDTDLAAHERRAFHHAWPALGMVSILIALITAARMLRPDAPGAVSETVQWLGLTIGLTIGAARWSVRLLGGD